MSEDPEDFKTSGSFKNPYLHVVEIQAWRQNTINTVLKIQ